ncbi:hypothetical protein [Prauserella flavalba]|uniref:hypothetical protein n=1 Tax=Prauserella flavalba TaxID=1477506 RepID=UPI00143DD9B3|nr:hypothetical protein [Prauserella flavalba]
MMTATTIAPARTRSAPSIAAQYTLMAVTISSNVARSSSTIVTSPAIEPGWSKATV